jgi:FeoB-associated Cys-rich membrane protein
VNSSLQTFLALVIVALAVTWLALRAFAKKKNPGCGGDCGCATDELKAKLKR